MNTSGGSNPINNISGGSNPSNNISGGSNQPLSKNDASGSARSNGEGQKMGIIEEEDSLDDFSSSVRSLF